MLENGIWEAILSFYCSYIRDGIIWDDEYYVIICVLFLFFESFFRMLQYLPLLPRYFLGLMMLHFQEEQVSGNMCLLKSIKKI